ncbi:hypothetical protein [Roseovarius rhodophyticola]|uniref:Uncharacterized protein n=1 Tax=Roseovarius rhodophyticola TaxID=3080827 RepID=A0ABZ2TFG8_9RHOB|nr:hypothetical protein [Roseovarius sp. W115]MDV2928719.1 hypothetical protein [Roseovarius sp. W115]
MIHLLNLSLATPRALLSAVAANGGGHTSENHDAGFAKQPSVSRDELLILFHDKLR